MEWPKLLSPIRSRELWDTEVSGTESDDHRSAFQRDYDRTLFSTPVRRLQDKAQVFPLEPNDSVRTRLTHSHEVSTVAFGIAQTVTQSLIENDEINHKQAESIRTIARTCGLIHDLGNPPFGHAGEEAMRTWFEKRLQSGQGIRNNLLLIRPEQQLINDFLKFDGNAQTIRIITKLQVLADLHGLNLTAATLSAACKYIAFSDGIDKKRHECSKIGYLYSELELINKLRERTGTGNARNPISYIVEAADDITYSTIDIEDGIRRGALNWNDFVQHFQGDYKTKESQKLASDLIARIENYIHDRIGVSIKLEGNALDETRIQLFRTYLIGYHVAAVKETFLEKYESIMSGEYHNSLIDDMSTSELMEKSKEIVIKKVIPHKDILKLEITGREVIHGLMDIFWEGVENAGPGITQKGFPGKIYQLLSGNYRQVFESSVMRDPDLIDYYRLQLVSDYICGMTDSYACNLHRQINNV